VYLELKKSESNRSMPQPGKHQLKLTLLQGTFAIVRLDAGGKPPNWFWDSKFCCLTKTNDELSLMCDQEALPSNVGQSSYCKTDLGIFRVEGLLAFGLTETLNKLTSPLTKTGISIFAISACGTIYISVERQWIFDSGYAWILAGHKVEGLPTSRIPVDGRSPVVTFEKDAMVQQMVDLIENKEGVEETFGLVVNAGWVPAEATQSAYINNLLPAVQECFKKADYTIPAPGGDIPKVYFYPSQYLHVTVATLHAFTRPTPDLATRAVLTKEWNDLVKAASKHCNWPTEPLQLTVQSAQLGKRAGILLWEETTGGLDQMRICIQAETEARHQRFAKAGVNADTLSIPNIIHSTFLRFHEVPESIGKEVQELFQRHVKDKLTTFFPDPISVPHAKLVCERIPYMHIPDDKDHVIATFQFGV